MNIFGYFRKILATAMVFAVGIVFAGNPFDHIERKVVVHGGASVRYLRAVFPNVCDNNDAFMRDYSLRCMRCMAEDCGWTLLSDEAPATNGVAAANAEVDFGRYAVEVAGLLEREDESNGEWHLTRQSILRRPLALYARVDDQRFINGLQSKPAPVVVGYVKRHASWRNIFEQYIANRSVPYRLVAFEDFKSLRHALKTSKVDSILMGASVGESLKLIEECGFVEYYLGVRNGSAAVLDELSAAVERMRMRHIDLYQKSETEFFGSLVLRPKVRLAAYNEVGLAEVDENGRMIGFVVDYARKIAEINNWDLICIYTSYVEAQKLLAEGKVDLMGAVVKTEARQKIYDYSEADIGPLYYALKTVRGGSMRPNRIDSWQDVSVGVLAGSLAVHDLERFFAERGIRWREVRYENLLDAENDLRQGRLDAVYTLLSRHSTDLLSLAVMPTALTYFCSNKEKSWIKQGVDSAMTAIREQDAKFQDRLAASCFPSSGRALSLDVDELKYVRSMCNRRIRVDYGFEWVPLMSFDSMSDEVHGFFLRMLNAIGEATGLTFEYLPPAGHDMARQRLVNNESDLWLVLGGREERGDNLLIEHNWFNLPAVFIRRGRGLSAMPTNRRKVDIAAVERLRPDDIEFVRRLGMQVLECDSLFECYQAVQDGEATVTIDSLPSGRYLLDESGRYRDLRYVRIDTELYSRKISLVFSSDVDPRLRSIMNKAIAAISEDDCNNYMFDSIYADHGVAISGEQLLLTIAIFVLIALLGFIIFMRRAAARHRREVALRVELLNNAPVAVFVKNADDDYRYIDANHIAFEYTGLARDELIGHVDRELFNAELAEIYRKNDENAIKTGLPFRIQEDFIGQNGVRRILQSIRCPVQDADGRHLVIDYSMDITDIEAMKRAEAANVAKTVFLSNMSHDIRTPLNAITGFTAIARRHLGDRRRAEECLDKIDVAGNHLLSLINQVLDMSRIESGRMELAPVACDAIEQANAVIVIEAELAKRKGVALEYDFSSVKHTMVMADVLRLNQVIMNIIGNAIKYTLSGGKVVYRMLEKASGEDWVDFEFVVSDNGIGMKPEYLAHIFEAFSRERNTTASGIEGSGLGMAIVKRIVELYGGTIDIRSQPGQGTTVTVNIRLALAPASAVKTEIPKIPAATAPSATMAATETATETAAADEKSPTRPAVGADNNRILLVEDNLLNREIAKDMLEELGFIVDEAEDGDIAVRKVTEAAPNTWKFVLMDIQMPRMNGHEATRAIRALPDRQRSAVIIIAMTANAFEEDRRAALEAGMDAHLAKPVSQAELLKTLEKFSIISEKR